MGRAGFLFISTVGIGRGGEAQAKKGQDGIIRVWLSVISGSSARHNSDRFCLGYLTGEIGGFH